MCISTLTQGAWKLIDQLEDPELRELASKQSFTVVPIVLSKNTLEHLEGGNRGQYSTSLHQFLQILMSFLFTCSTLVK